MLNRVLCIYTYSICTRNLFHHRGFVDKYNYPHLMSIIIIIDKFSQFCADGKQRLKLNVCVSSLPHPALYPRVWERSLRHIHARDQYVRRRVRGGVLPTDRICAQEELRRVQKGRPLVPLPDRSARPAPSHVVAVGDHVRGHSVPEPCEFDSQLGWVFA